MKRIVSFFAFTTIQVVGVLLLAHFARTATASHSLSGTKVTTISYLVFGIPAVAALIGHLYFTFQKSPSLRNRAIRLLAVGFVTFFTFGLGLGILQYNDKLLVQNYITRMQQQLSAEPRFQNVKLLGYSDDYILFPYIPVEGDVATELDRKDLDRLLKSSNPPAFVSAVIISVSGQPPSLNDFVNRVREK